MDTKHWAKLILFVAGAVGLSSPIFAGEASWLALMRTGNRFLNESNYEAAIEAFRSAAVEAKASGQTAPIGISFGNLGTAYCMLNRDREAEISLQQSITAWESAGEEFYSYLIQAWADLAALNFKL